MNTREDEYWEAMHQEVQVDGFASVKAWAAAFDLTLTEALDEGVWQDDDGTVWVPSRLWAWTHGVEERAAPSPDQCEGCARRVANDRRYCHDCETRLMRAA